VRVGLSNHAGQDEGRHPGPHPPSHPQADDGNARAAAAGRVPLCAASSLDKELKGDGAPRGATVASAKKVGQLIASRAKEKGILAVVFDRGGFQYHGRIKALADAARESGLKF